LLAGAKKFKVLEYEVYELILKWENDRMFW
jgi:hypothetical protein